MTQYIVGLLSLGAWELLFSTCFFFGLIFFVFIILGALGDDSDADAEDLDADGDVDADLDADADLDTGLDELDLDSADLIDIDGDGIPDGWDLDGDGVIDVDFDGAEFDLDADAMSDLGELDADALDTDLDVDADLDTDGLGDLDSDGLDFDDFEHIELHSGEIEPRKDYSIEYRSSYKIGNISAFLFAFGGTGWLNLSRLSDTSLLTAVLVGYLTMKAFDWIIANYAKTVVVPIMDITRGDIGTVIYGITPEKIGIVQVRRRDGVISTIMARGAFPHDFFSKGDRGYIWAKKGEFYLMTRGVAGQPDLEETTSKPSKALDTPPKALDGQKPKALDLQ